MVFWFIFRLIDDTSKKLHRSPTSILLEEWGTSGRRRATVSDLLDLLVKVQLYRAADFVAKDILKAPMPERPHDGPGARVDVTMPPETIDAKAIEQFLNDVTYPNSSHIAAHLDSMINNNNRDLNHLNVDHVKSFHIYNSSDELTSDQCESDSQSDLIVFSAKTVSNSDNNMVDETSGQTCETVFSPAVSTNELTYSTTNLESSKECNGLSDNSISLSSGYNMPNLPDLSAPESKSINQTGSQLDSQIDDSQSSSIIESSLIPDIKILQLKDSIEHSTLSSSSTIEGDVYIPNLPQLNGNSS